jgi:tetratricopeptide (TPR) repeat protein
VLEENEVGQVGKEDPVKAHRDGTALHDSGNYEGAIDKFLQAYPLYKKAGDFFDASYVLFKAAECSFFLENYEIAIERFLKAAEIASERGYDRFKLGALEYAQDCYKAAGKESGEDVAELKKRIAEVKKKIEAQAV